MEKKGLLVSLAVGFALNAVALKAITSGTEQLEDTDKSYSISDVNNDSDKEHKRLQKDSIMHNRFCNFLSYNADVPLTERFKLFYGSTFYPIDSVNLKLNVSFAFVIDNVTNDSTAIQMKNHRYALVSNAPLVLVDVFEVEHDGHEYVVHELYDARTYFNSKEEKNQPTRACYQIR